MTLRAKFKCALAALCAAGAGSSAFGFTLFGFRTLEEINDGRFYFWQEIDPDAPVVLSYAVEDSFLSNEAHVSAQEAREAALRALETWRTSTCDAVQFSQAIWTAVPNSGERPPFDWEGPGWQEWLDDRALPPGEQQFIGWRAGWGSNIDIFSRPTGFSITSYGETFLMGPNVLAFSIVNRTGNRILSTDIYLNESFEWRTDGGAGFDIETVVLHELGHTLGFDHPQEAVPNGSVNLDPTYFEPGWPWSSADVMHPAYTGVKRALTGDERGALVFLYDAAPADLVADINGDGQVNSSDLGQLLAMWGTANPDGDLNQDGLVNSSDLGMLLGQWTHAAPQ